jgi:hypothetical protein
VSLDKRVGVHRAIGYVTPLDKVERREAEIFAERDPELQEVRRQTQLRRQEALRNLLSKPPEMTGEASAAGLN